MDFPWRPRRQPDGRLQEADALAAKLRNEWGLGLDEDGAGYRNRLKRLCEFLRHLEPDESTPDRQSDFDRFKRARPTGARKRCLQKLEKRKSNLKLLVKAEGETPEDYVTRVKDVKDWSAVEGFKAVSEQVGDLNRLRELLARETCLAAAERLKSARKQWRECVDDFAGDWEWLLLQVLVRLARECRRERPDSPRFCGLMGRAQAALCAAIPRMENLGFGQYRTEGLYASLAETYLARAKHCVTQPAKRLKLTERAFTYARHAVEIEPASIRERRALLDVLATLGDAEELNEQAEIALNLDSGPDTLRTIGASLWERAKSLPGRGPRRRLLRDAARFFEGARQEVESASFDRDGPLDQMQAHGWAHFWLGRFQGERGRWAEAIAHLRAASALGFKPLESRVEVAWACSRARYRKDADDAFREALVEAGRQRDLGKTVSQAAGEERKIDDLAFDAHLGWAARTSAPRGRAFG